MNKDKIYRRITNIIVVLCNCGIIVGDRAGVPNVAVLVTDWPPTHDVSNILPAAQAARDSGIRVTTDKDTYYLKCIHI